MKECKYRSTKGNSTSVDSFVCPFMLLLHYISEGYICKYCTFDITTSHLSNLNVFKSITVLYFYKMKRGTIFREITDFLCFLGVRGRRISESNSVVYVLTIKTCYL